MRLLLSTFCVLAVALCAAPTMAAVTYGGSYTSAPVSGVNYIGWQGNGSLTIDQTGTSGGTVAITGGITEAIGGASGYPLATGTVTITGGAAASTFSDNFRTYVGYYGIGNVYVYSGGTFAPTATTLGVNANSVGTVTIDGVYNNGTTTTPSTWNASSIAVGNNGSGTVNITNGGLASDVAGCSIGGSSGTTTTGAGSVTVDGCTGALSSTLNVNTGAGTTNYLYVAGNRDSSLTISNGGIVHDTGANCYIGYNSTRTGTVTVTGSNANNVSQFTVSGGTNPNNQYIYVGYSGTGVLHIANGGLVTDSYAVMGQNPGATGTVTIDGAGSTWTTTASNNSFLGYSGLMTITNGGILNTGLADIGGSNVSTAPFSATVDGLGSTWTDTSDLNVGWYKTGSLTISNGATVTATGNLNLGYWGNAVGTLKISTGGTLTSGTAQIGSSHQSGSGSGTASVDGAGSTWTINGSGLNVGSSTPGAVYISGAATVTTPNVAIVSGSLLEIDAGRGSSLAIGSAGALTNSGTVRVVAGAGATAAGAYTPITVGGSAWAGNGTVQALGGTWDGSTFTASSVTPGTAGAAVTVNPSASQRTLITDTASGTSLGASFMATTASFNLTASTLSGAGVTPPTLSGSGAVLSGWALSAPGYSGDPAYLSLSTGRIYPGTGVLWSSSDSGVSWSAIVPNDLTFDNTNYASFSPTALDAIDYAVSGLTVLPGDANLDGKVDINDLTVVLAHYNQTGMVWSEGEFTGSGTVDINDLTIVLAHYNGTASAPGIQAVPEPASLLLLAAGLAGLLASAWRRRK